MTSATVAQRSRLAMVAVTMALLCPEPACSLQSLDYLTNGSSSDAETAEAAPGAPAPLDGTPPFDGLSDRAHLEAAAPAADGGGGGTDASAATDTIGEAPSGEAGGGGAGGAGGATDAAERETAAETGRDGGAVTGGSGGAARTGGATGGGGAGSGGSTRTGGTVGSGGRTGAGGASTGGTGGSDAAATSDAAAPDDTTPDRSPGRPWALFVVGAIPLGSGDSALASRLTARGFTVELVDDQDLAALPTVRHNVILISRTVSATNVRAKFRAIEKPVLVWEANLYDDMGLVDGNASGTYGTVSTPAPGFDSLLVDSRAHPLTAGLSGTVAVVATAGEMVYGVPNPQAITVASLPGQPTLWPIFAYDRGVPMYGLDAPERRVGFFFALTAPTNLTSNGWLLFDAAIDWLTE